MILIYWLIFFTICLQYFKKLTWNSFFRTWLPIFTLWYLILIVSLGKYSPIIIGPGYTEELMEKALYDGIYFERICFSTILTLHMFSSFLGFPILIPIVFNIFKRIWRTDCARDDESRASKKTNSTQSGWWFGGDKRTQNQKDAEICSKLANQMAETEYRHPLYQHESMDSEDGKRVTHNVSTRFPGFGLQNFCVSTNKKNLKKDDKKA
jgi:hypothetical protein